MPVTETKPVISHDKKKISIKLNKMRRVEYVFLDEGEFLYECDSHKLFGVNKPHTYIGYINPDTLEVTTIVD